MKIVLEEAHLSLYYPSMEKYVLIMHAYIKTYFLVFRGQNETYFLVCRGQNVSYILKMVKGMTFNTIDPPLTIFPLPTEINVSGDSSHNLQGSTSKAAGNISIT